MQTLLSVYISSESLIDIYMFFESHREFLSYKLGQFG